MSDIWATILEKLNAKSVAELNAEERKTFLEWQRVYTQPDVSLDDFKKLLPAELERACRELIEYKNGPKKDLFYKAYIRILETLTAIITTPQKERGQLRAELKRRFNIE